MDHQRFNDLIKYYLSDNLSPEDVKSFEIHIAECKECRDAFLEEITFKKAFAFLKESNIKLYSKTEIQNMLNNLIESRQFKHVQHSELKKFVAKHQDISEDKQRALSFFSGIKGLYEADGIEDIPDGIISQIFSEFTEDEKVVTELLLDGLDGQEICSETNFDNNRLELVLDAIGGKLDKDFIKPFLASEEFNLSGKIVDAWKDSLTKKDR